MAFGVPLAVGLVAVAVLFIRRRIRSAPEVEVPRVGPGRLDASARTLIAIVAATILLWLTEGLHGWPAWWVAMGAIATIVLLRLVRWEEIRHMDWTTLLLIAGGIGVGRLLERSGAIRSIASGLPLETMPEVAVVFLLCITSASLSALMSNTGTAAMLIPLAATVDPSPSTAVLIAVAASLGVPFVISTPPNAIAVANGLRSRELLRPGLFALVGGCAIVALTGPWVLHRVGIP
jgi:sodium-dependent dicarboxylate transporter 2/3/5